MNVQHIPGGNAPLQHPTFASVSRNFDLVTNARIAAESVLPADWESRPLLKLAHRLYWEEHSVLHCSV